MIQNISVNGVICVREGRNLSKLFFYAIIKKTLIIINIMLTYPEILKETLSLNPDEQKQLLEELTKVINQQTNPTKNLDKWFVFLPKRIEPMEFQLEIRKEW